MRGRGTTRCPQQPVPLQLSHNDRHHIGALRCGSRCQAAGAAAVSRLLPDDRLVAGLIDGAELLQLSASCCDGGVVVAQVLQLSFGSDGMASLG